MNILPCLLLTASLLPLAGVPDGTTEYCCTGGDAMVGRCTGSPNCTACKNCTSCAYCKAGGTCGVCAPGRPKTPAPLTPSGASPAAAPASASPPPAAEEDGVAVYFSPGGHCTEAIVQEIQKAKHSIRVLAYRLTSPEIDAALVAARGRAVDVSIVLDGAQQSEKYTDATFFANQGAPVLIDATHAIAHNKVMLIDDTDIITGSFNFTGAAEKSNAENLLVIKDKPLVAKAYLAEFQRHVAHSKPYRSPADGQGGGNEK